MGVGDVAARVGFSAAACVGVGLAGIAAMGGPWGFVLGCVTGLALVNSDTKPGCAKTDGSTPPEGGDGDGGGDVDGGSGDAGTVCGGDMGDMMCSAPPDAGEDLFTQGPDLAGGEDAGRPPKRGVNTAFMKVSGFGRGDIRDFYVDANRAVNGVLGPLDSGIFVSASIPLNLADALRYSGSAGQLRNDSYGMLTGAEENGRVLKQLPNQIVPFTAHGKSYWAIPTAGESSNLLNQKGGAAIVSQDALSPLPNGNVRLNELIEFLANRVERNSTAISSVVECGGKLCFAAVETNRSKGMIFECGAASDGEINQMTNCGDVVFTSSTGEAVTVENLGNSKFLVLNHGDSMRGVDASVDIIDWSSRAIVGRASLGAPDAVRLPHIAVSADRRWAAVAFASGDVKAVDLSDLNNPAVSAMPANVGGTPRGLVAAADQKAWVSVNGGLKMVDFKGDFNAPAVDRNSEIRDIADDLGFCILTSAETLSPQLLLPDLILCAADVDGEKNLHGRPWINDIVAVSPECATRYDSYPGTYVCPPLKGP